MDSAYNSNALLLFRVGPVLCAAPCLAVVGLITPPALTRTPDSDEIQPGMFRHEQRLVRVQDLRVRFGVAPKDRAPAGRLVIAETEGGLFGFRVDEVVDVVAWPDKGWGRLPVLLPQEVFSRTLQWRDRIYLYGDFDQFGRLQGQDLLQSYLRTLQPERAEREPAEPESRVQTDVARTLPPAAPITQVAPRMATPSPSPAKAAPETGPPAKPAVRPSARAPLPVAPRPVVKPAPVAEPETSRPVAPATVPPPELPIAQPPPAGNVTSAVPQASSSPPPSAAYGALLGAILLLLLLGGGAYGLYGLLPGESGAESFATLATPVPAPDSRDVREQVASVSAPLAVIPEPEPMGALEAASELQAGLQVGPQTVPEAPPVVESVAVSTSSPDAYRAHIAEDEEGITIVLEVPDDSPALYAPQPEAIAQADPDPGLTFVGATDGGVPEAHADDLRPTPEQPSPVPAQAQAPREVVHVVVSGDTLWHIAERYVRDPFRYPELARLSNISNPDLIYPGNRVRIIIRTRGRSQDAP